MQVIAKRCYQEWFFSLGTMAVFTLEGLPPFNQSPWTGDEDQCSTMSYWVFPQMVHFSHGESVLYIVGRNAKVHFFTCSALTFSKLMFFLSKLPSGKHRWQFGSCACAHLEHCHPKWPAQPQPGWCRQHQWHLGAPFLDVRCSEREGKWPRWGRWSVLGWHWIFESDTLGSAFGSSGCGGWVKSCGELMICVMQLLSTVVVPALLLAKLTTSTSNCSHLLFHST